MSEPESDYKPLDDFTLAWMRSLRREWRTTEVWRLLATIADRDARIAALTAKLDNQPQITIKEPQK